MSVIRRNNNRIVFITLLIAVLIVIMVASPKSALGSIDEQLINELNENGRTNVFVKMSNDAELTSIESLSNRAERLNSLHDTLVNHANAEQTAVQRYLERRGYKYDSFWINNSLYIYDANMALVNALSKRADVAYVRADHQIELHLPVETSLATAVGPLAIEWGVDMINAPDVWATGNTGQGIVIANIDTGVRWTHNALNGQYRGNGGDHNYNWWDPDGVHAAPTDSDGHGTHTMGTMVGDDGGANQVGVAPGAQWIAAQGCDGVFCTDFDLISSAQWIACPTDLNGNNPDCTKAPHVVNNSWGGGGGDPWYASYVQSWVAAGIMPVFSAGNSGPSCSTAGSPGDYPKVIGVGAVDINMQLASFSSKGPGLFTKLKPNVVAPGDNVRSSYGSGDNSYANLSGTSMAAPHVAGAVALMMADSPTVTLGQVFSALTQNAVQGLPAPQSSPNTCGGRSYTVYPNAIYGRGLIDVFAAVNALP